MIQQEELFMGSGFLHARRSALISAVAAVLSACGGGGSSEGVATAPTSSVLEHFVYAPKKPLIACPKRHEDTWGTLLGCETVTGVLAMHEDSSPRW